MTTTQSGADGAAAGDASNPFATLFQPQGAATSAAPPTEPATSGAPNAAPLPNPWAPPPASGGAAAGTPAAGGQGAVFSAKRQHVHRAASSWKSRLRAV